MLIQWFAFTNKSILKKKKRMRQVTSIINTAPPSPLGSYPSDFSSITGGLQRQHNKAHIVFQDTHGDGVYLVMLWVRSFKENHSVSLQE